jgi:hypothetical protein
LQANQFGNEYGVSIDPPIGVTALEDEVLTFDPAELAKTPPQHIHDCRNGRGPEHPHAVDLSGVLGLAAIGAPRAASELSRKRRRSMPGSWGGRDAQVKRVAKPADEAAISEPTAPR